MKKVYLFLLLLGSCQLWAQEMQVENTIGNKTIIRAGDLTFDNADNSKKFTIFASTNLANPEFSLNYQVFGNGVVVSDNIFNYDTENKRFGIGKINPEAIFHVERGIQPQALFGDGGGNLSYVTINQPSNAVNNTDGIFRVRDNGITIMRVNEGARTFQVDINGDGRVGSIWTVSDQRLKKQVQPLRKVLGKINRLRPSIYDYQSKSTRWSYLNLPEEQQFGLIAQELQKVFPNLVRSSMEYDENGGELGELHTVNYLGLIPVLLAGIQEQQQLIEIQKAQIEDLENSSPTHEQFAILLEKVNDLEAQLATLPASKTTTQPHKTAQLFQNHPNPFQSTTQIPFFIPQSVQKARLLITNAQGKLLQNIPITTRGNGVHELTTHRLASGSYFYTLMADGQKVASRQMFIP